LNKKTEETPVFGTKGRLRASFFRLFPPFPRFFRFRNCLTASVLQKKIKFLEKKLRKRLRVKEKAVILHPFSPRSQSG